MKIYIPTYGRSDSQKTLSNLVNSKIKQHVYIVVQDREREKYNYPRTITLPKNIQTLSPTRQWILENADTDKIVMMDDDLTLYRRITPSEPKTRKCTEQDVIDLYDWLDESLDNHVHSSVSMKYMNIGKKIYQECAKAQCVLGYRRMAILRTGCRFDNVLLLQTEHMNLQLLIRGFPNIVNHEFSYHETPYTPGGCSEYRKMDEIEKHFSDLAKLHPGLIEVRKGRPTDKEPDGRVYVVVSYKKAFKISQGLI
jgi:hypothetical protein